MPKIHFNTMVIGTFQRLFGIDAFLDAIDAAIPTLEAKENQDLEHLAVQEGWERSDYYIEKVDLDAKFRNWVPNYATYSIIILLYSVLETQLFAFAEHLGKKQNAKLRVKHLAGKGVEQAASYLEHVVPFPVKSDQVWPLLKDLQLLRNIVVHRGGNPGASKDDQKAVDGLIQKYPSKLALHKADGMHDQIWISMNLCRDFAREIDGFFVRIFRLAGLPNRSGQMDS